MSCSGAVVGGRRRKSKRGGDLTEPTPMSTPTPAPTPTTTGLLSYLPDFLKPKTGGRRITRKAHWRYIRGLKIRLPSRKSAKRHGKTSKVHRKLVKKTFRK
jgi:hypothetical protein